MKLTPVIIQQYKDKFHGENYKSHLKICSPEPKKRGNNKSKRKPDGAGNEGMKRVINMNCKVKEAK